MFLWGGLKATDIVRAAHALADIVEERRVAQVQEQAVPTDPPTAGNSTRPHRPSPAKGAPTALHNTVESRSRS